MYLDSKLSSWHIGFSIISVEFCPGEEGRHSLLEAVQNCMDSSLARSVKITLAFAFFYLAAPILEVCFKDSVAKIMKNYLP